MKKIIESILKKTGYELSKLPDIQLVQKPKNLIVEFIGPSSVGKTTHFLGFLNQTPLSLVNGRSLSNPRIKSQEDYIKDYHIEILKGKIYNLFSQSHSNWFVYDHIKYYIQCIDIDLKCLHVEGCIICEEGLFHNFTSEFIDLHKSNSGLLHSAFNNRAYISIASDPEIIFAQAVKRADKTNFILQQYNKFEKSKEKILEWISKDLAKTGELVNIIKLYHRPCLELKVENSLEKNIRLIETFLKERVEEMRR